MITSDKKSKIFGKSEIDDKNTKSHPILVHVGGKNQQTNEKVNFNSQVNSRMSVRHCKLVVAMDADNLHYYYAIFLNQ